MVRARVAATYLHCAACISAADLVYRKATVVDTCALRGQQVRLPGDFSVIVHGLGLKQS
jgi:hypothetical protein